MPSVSRSAQREFAHPFGGGGARSERRQNTRAPCERLRLHRRRTPEVRRCPFSESGTFYIGDLLIMVTVPGCGVRDVPEGSLVFPCAAPAPALGRY